MTLSEDALSFPVVAFSPAGWLKEAASLDELNDASADDSLADWQGLEIYDSSGRRFVVTRAFVAHPKSSFGQLSYRVLNQQVTVGFEFSQPESISVDELLRRLAGQYACLADRMAGATHRQILEAISA